MKIWMRRLPFLHDAYPTDHLKHAGRKSKQTTTHMLSLDWPNVLAAAMVYGMLDIACDVCKLPCCVLRASRGATNVCHGLWLVIYGLWELSYGLFSMVYDLFRVVSGIWHMARCMWHVACDVIVWSRRGTPTPTPPVPPAVTATTTTNGLPRQRVTVLTGAEYAANVNSYVNTMREETCCVCRCSINVGDICDRPRECGHPFCDKCLREWGTKYMPTCPMCRGNLRQPNGRGGVHQTASTRT